MTSTAPKNPPVRIPIQWKPAPDVVYDELASLQELGQTFRRLQVSYAIFTVNDNEYNQVYARFDPLEGHDKCLAFSGNSVTYVLGRFGGCNAVLFGTNGVMGPSTGAILEEALSTLARLGSPVKLLLNIGVLYGFQPKTRDGGDQEIGDVVVSSMAIGAFVNDKASGGVLLSRTNRPGMPHRLNNLTVVTKTSRFIESFTKAMGRPPKVHRGAVISAGVLVNDLHFRDQLEARSDASGVIAGDMECWMVANAALNHEIQWLFVKGISDWGDGTKASRTDKRTQPYAAAAATLVAEALLAQHSRLRTATSSSGASDHH